MFLWIKTGKLQLKQPEAIKDFDRLQILAVEFEKLQREHLNREDEDFSPLVKAVLNNEQREQVGVKMAELRHLEIN